MNPLNTAGDLHGLNYLHGPITSTGCETEPYELDVTTEPEQDDQNRSDREKSKSGILFFKKHFKTFIVTRFINYDIFAVEILNEGVCYGSRQSLISKR